MPVSCHFTGLGGVFLCADSPIVAHICDIRGGWLMIAVHVDIIKRILLSEFKESTVGVDATVRNCRRFESLEGSIQIKNMSDEGWWLYL